MSGGRSFGQQEPLSDQDRIAELERKIPILLDRIAQCDQISAKLETYVTTMLGLASDLSAAHAKIKELELNLGLLAQSSANYSASSVSSQQNLQSSIESIKKASEAEWDKVYKWKESFDEQYKESLNKHFSLNQTKADKAEVDGISQMAKTMIDQYSKSFTDQVLDIANRVAVFTSKISDQVKEYSSAEDLKIFKGEVADMVGAGVGLCKQIVDQARHDFGEQLSSAYEKFSLESGKISQNFPNFDTLRQEIDKKVQDLALDSQNATIRTKNSDQKIINLEKRIENIDLRLKHQELQRG